MKGNDLYGAVLTELSHNFTNKQIELFPGTYTVKLNNIVRTATVQEEQNTIVKSGTVSVSGTGSTYYYVYDSDFNELSHKFTNKQIELFPGNYTVKLNKTFHAATVQEEQNTVVKSGTVSVSGTGSTYYYVYDSDFNELAHNFTNKQIDLFPGNYTVKLSDAVQTANVHEEQHTIIDF